MSRFLVPSLDRGGLSLYGLAGGPEYYLDADNSRCGTTGARSFDGEQYVELASKLNPGTSDVCISGFVNIEDSDGVQTILATGARAASEAGIWLVTVSNERLYCYVCDGTTRISGYISDATLLGGWKHIAVVINRTAKTVTAYVNNVLQTAQLDISTVAGSLNGGLLIHYIGRCYVNDIFNGNLSKLAYFESLLTTDEIAELYNSGNGITRAMYSAGLAAKTVHSWNCNEAPEATLYDSTNENHGTPSLPGTELVTNGGFEDRTGDDFDDWVEGTNGSSTVNAETSDVDAGSVSCRFDVVDGDIARVEQSNVLTIGHEYSLTFRAKTSTAGKRVGYDNDGPVAIVTPMSWGDINVTFTAAQTSLSIRKFEAAGDYSIYLDSVSVVRTGPHVGSTAGPEETDYLTPGNGDTIVSETSIAGTTTNFIQADIEYRPTWEEDAFGSYPGIAFAGTDDYLAHSGALISDYPFVMPVLFKGETKAAQALVDISDVSARQRSTTAWASRPMDIAVARKRNGGAFATVTDDEDICDGDAHLIIAVFTSDTHDPLGGRRRDRYRHRQTLPWPLVSTRSRWVPWVAQ
jgi:hypothetical protein